MIIIIIIINMKLCNKRMFKKLSKYNKGFIVYKTDDVIDTICFYGAYIEYKHDIDYFAYYGHLSLLYLYPERKCTYKALNRASRHGFIDIVRWLCCNKSDKCFKRHAFKLAKDNGHKNVVNYLQSVI
jgi:hypothetical protein